VIPGGRCKIPEFGRGDYGRAELENAAADGRCRKIIGGNAVVEKAIAR